MSNAKIVNNIRRIQLTQELGQLKREIGNGMYKQGKLTEALNRMFAIQTEMTEERTTRNGLSRYGIIKKTMERIPEHHRSRNWTAYYNEITRTLHELEEATIKNEL
jgi:hypothetical protein